MHKVLESFSVMEPAKSHSAWRLLSDQGDLYLVDGNDRIRRTV